MKRNINILTYVFIVAATTLALPTVVVSAKVKNNKTYDKVKVNVSFLPTIIYRNERRSAGFTVACESYWPQRLECQFETGTSLQKKIIDFTIAEDRLVTFELRIDNDDVLPMKASFRVVNMNGKATVNTAVDIMIRSNLDGMSDVRVEGNRLSDAAGRPLVIVKTPETEADRRRWLPIHWLKERIPRPAQTVFFHGAERLFDFINTERAANGLPVTHLPYDGNPLSACLNVPEAIISAGKSAVVIGWGLDEMRYRYDRDLFERAMETFIDRARKIRPDTRIYLLTIPPPSGNEKLAAAYAESIHSVARRQRIRVIDWHGTVLRSEDWRQSYFFNNDPSVLTELPHGMASVLIKMLAGML